MARYVKFLMGLRTSPSMSRVGVEWWHNLSECELSEVSDLAQPHYYKCSQENKCWLARCQHFLTETNRGWLGYLGNCWEARREAHYDASETEHCSVCALN